MFECNKNAIVSQRYVLGFSDGGRQFVCLHVGQVCFEFCRNNQFFFSLTIRSSRSEEEVAPFCSFLSHSKEITDVAFSWFDSMFMLSAGLDHRLVLYDLNSKTMLQKIHFDAELTACAFNLSDTFLFCGTKTGRLVKLSLFHAVSFWWNLT